MAQVGEATPKRQSAVPELQNEINRMTDSVYRIRAKCMELETILFGQPSQKPEAAQKMAEESVSGEIPTASYKIRTNLIVLAEAESSLGCMLSEAGEIPVDTKSARLGGR